MGRDEVGVSFFFHYPPKYPPKASMLSLLGALEENALMCMLPIGSFGFNHWNCCTSVPCVDSIGRLSSLLTTDTFEGKLLGIRVKSFFQ